MKILILAHSYPPHKDGIAQAASTMAGVLAARGHDVQIGTGFHPQRSTAASTGPRVHHFNITGSSNLREGIHGDAAAYQAFVAAFDGDAIVCFCWQIWSTDLVLNLSPPPRARMILVSHGYNAHLLHWQRRFPWGLGQWIGWQPYVIRLPMFLRRCSRVVFLSPQADWHRFFDLRIARLIRHPGIRVIPNTITIEQRESLPDFRQTFSIRPGCMFLCVANYFHHKNQALALRAFRRAQLPGATMVFIGSEATEYLAALRSLDRELAASYPAGNVYFLKGLDRRLTLAAYAAGDVVVLTANEESQPLVLLEAMAFGKPFVSTPSSNWVRGLPGGVVVRSERDISTQMQRLSADAAARTALGDAGRSAFLSQYSHEKVAAHYEELLC